MMLEPCLCSTWFVLVVLIFRIKLISAGDNVRLLLSFSAFFSLLGPGCGCLAAKNFFRGNNIDDCTVQFEVTVPGHRLEKR